jgi:hypothetical protein
MAESASRKLLGKSATFEARCKQAVDDEHCCQRGIDQLAHRTAALAKRAAG